MQTQAELIQGKAQELVQTALVRTRNQLETAWQRADLDDPGALLVRRELLALQRVEQNLTRAIEGAQNQ